MIAPSFFSVALNSTEQFGQRKTISTCRLPHGMKKPYGKAGLESLSA